MIGHSVVRVLGLALLPVAILIPASSAARAPLSPNHLPPGIHAHYGQKGEIDINACAKPGRGHVACFARVRIDARARGRRPAEISGATSAATIGDNGAYSPAYLQSAYNTPSATGGVGQTVAIVDAYDAPNAEADLATYRSSYGLPDCTTDNGCFRKLNQAGTQGDYPAPNGDWALETSLDLDMVSALCPNCHILLVEANSNSFDDMASSERKAASLGANVISDSWGLDEFPTQAAHDSDFVFPGVATVVASGDFGYPSPLSYPAASPGVIAVGGTRLIQTTSDGTRNATETAWARSESGCSVFGAKPARQQDSCPRRTVADVSAVADPATPVWAYDSYPHGGSVNWLAVGGTSASAPIVAAIYALAHAPSGSAYQPAESPYAHPDAFNDITSGSTADCGTAYCTTAPGYDPPTGWGSPNGTQGFMPAAPTAPVRLKAGARHAAVTLAWSAPNSNGGAQISGYRLYRSDRGAAPIAILPGSERTFTDSGLSDGTTYTYSIAAVNALQEGPSTSVSARPAPLDHLGLAPAPSTLRAGEPHAYEVLGFAADGRSLGDETAATSFSITPNGSCTEANCSATVAGTHVVFASLGGKSARADLAVDPASLAKVVVSPTNAAILPGEPRTFRAEGQDQYGNSLGNWTSNAVFQIAPDGSCTGATCTATSAGEHHVTAILKSTAVSVSEVGFGCAATGAAGVMCWGNNLFDDIGGDQTFVWLPKEIPGLEHGVTAVAAGVTFSCALLNSGGVKCWGLNQDGRLGNASATASLVPDDVYGLTQGVASIHANEIGCAVTTAGGPQCWGLNDFGMIGDGTTQPRWRPTPVSGLSNGVAAVSGGWGFTCALTTSGGVKCWGYQPSAGINSPTPADVPGLTRGVKQISAGFAHICALTEVGGIKCWGDNKAGALGNGTNVDSADPVDVTGLSAGVASISAGLAYTCAVTTAGAAKCWGHNDSGQLGTGTTKDSNVPVDVVGLTHGMQSVSAGNQHTCGLTDEGLVKCWGSNIYGELGIGSISFIPFTPVTTLMGSSSTAALEVGAETLAVNKSGSGSGAVSSMPAGIDCGTTCSHAYAPGTAVTLTATAAAGSTFGGWSGDCSGTDTCRLAMGAAHSVTATFVLHRYCIVPKIKGRKLTIARTAIAKAGCRTGKITRLFSERVKKGHVISQRPRPGRRLVPGGRVDLTVSKGKRRQTIRRELEIKTPTGNIQCDLWLVRGSAPHENAIRCAVLSTANAHGRTLTWFLSHRGRVRVSRSLWRGEASGRRTLAYGRSIRLGRMRCVSRRLGLRCWRVRSGHGFFLSRERQRTF